MNRSSTLIVGLAKRAAELAGAPEPAVGGGLQLGGALAAPDMTKHISQLEAMRQAVAARHQLQSEGAAAGGARAGGMMGGGAGATGGFGAALRGLIGSKVGFKGRAGLAGLAGVAGGLLGGGAGRSYGRTLGANSVTPLAEALKNPVTLDSSPAAISALAKTAEAKMRARLGREKKALNPFAPLKAVAKSPMKALGLGYGGALAAHHTGMTGSDPTAGMTDVQKYRHHTGEYNQAVSPLRAQGEAAIRDGDMTKAMDVQDQIASGNFGGSSYNNAFTRTFVPWLSGQPTAGVHQQRASEAGANVQRSYDQAMQKQVGVPGQFQTQLDQLTARAAQPGIMPAQRQLLKMHIDSLRRKMQETPPESSEALDIRRQMEGAGMPFSPFPGTPGRPQQPQPQQQPQQQQPQPVWGGTLSDLRPNDYRREYWDQPGAL